MTAPERFRLQFGPYAAPKAPRNNRLFCEMRGYLKVSPSWSDGLIPWPRRYRTGSIILCGDLVRAVKMESVEAVCFHWGVCRNVVQNWRPQSIGTRKTEHEKTMKNTCNNAEGGQNPEKQPTLVAGKKPNGKSQITFLTFEPATFFHVCIHAAEITT